MADLWSWLTPLAACALTIVVQAARQPSVSTSDSKDNAYYAKLMACSNETAYSLSKMDENVEWNIWPRASGPIQIASRADGSSVLLTRSLTNR